MLGFIIVTGAYSIINSLKRIFDHKPTNFSSNDHSSLEAAWFKLKAPIGFIYGIAALGGAIFFLSTSNWTKKSQDEDQFKDKSFGSFVESSSEKQVKVYVSTNDPISIFDGSILLIYQRHVWDKDALEFRGITGWSKSAKGPFEAGPLQISTGDQFFVKLPTDQIYGLNILNFGYHGQIGLEFFRVLPDLKKP
jgi:hypothetical protein